MCMLSFIPAGVDIESEDLLNGGLINADGSGWAIAVPELDTILMGKSMKVEEALDEFIEVRAKHPDCDALFHSRWATHGTVSTANVHPFLVGGSHKTVVGHNGILPCTPKKSDWRSDTRVLADEHLPTRYRRLDKPTVISALESYIGLNNKLLILTVDERYQKNAYLINESCGHWDTVTGVWHSNKDYLGWSAKYSYTGGGYTKVGNTWVPSTTNKYDPITRSWSGAKGNCTFCGYGYVGKAGYCLECGTCEDCFQFRKDCECWSSYYRNFDWDHKTTAQKALETARKELNCPTENNVPTLGYRDNKPWAKNTDRGGMSLSQIVDQIDAMESVDNE